MRGTITGAGIASAASFGLKIHSHGYFRYSLSAQRNAFCFIKHHHRNTHSISLVSFIAMNWIGCILSSEKRGANT